MHRAGTQVIGPGPRSFTSVSADFVRARRRDQRRFRSAARSACRTLRARCDVACGPDACAHRLCALGSGAAQRVRWGRADISICRSTRSSSGPLTRRDVALRVAVSGTCTAVRIVDEATTARVHGRDELETSRIANVAMRSSDRQHRPLPAVGASASSVGRSNSASSSRKSTP